MDFKFTDYFISTKDPSDLGHMTWIIDWSFYEGFPTVDQHKDLHFAADILIFLNKLKVIEYGKFYDSHWEVSIPIRGQDALGK